MSAGFDGAAAEPGSEADADASMARGESLDPTRTAVLVFDLLNGHVNKDPATRARFEPVIASAAALLAAARAAGTMVAYAHADHRADRATSAVTLRDTDNRLRPIARGAEAAHKPLLTGGTAQTRIVNELAPQPGDYMIPKHRWSAFHGTYLELALRTRHIDTLIVCGGSTDVGVASTAFAARDLDYHVVIASDACTSPEADNHRQFMQRIFPRMARVRTVTQIVAMLEGRAHMQGDKRLLCDG